MSRVTLKDIALAAGVSTAATSQALNDRGHLSAATRDRIKAVAAQLGYVPHRSAAALRSGRAMSIGFVMADGEDDETSRRWAMHRNRQLQALVRASAEHGFAVLVLPESRPDLLGGTQLDILYFPDDGGSGDMLRAAAAYGVPVVGDDLYIDAVSGFSVRTGYGAAVRAGLEHLASARAQRVGLLVEAGGRPRDRIGESAYRAWCAERGRMPLIAHVDPGRRQLPRRIRQLLDADADAVFAFCEQGPDVLVFLEATAHVVPRDVQLVALCSTECDLNDRLGVTHVCVHPELAAAAVVAALGRPAEPGVTVIDLPWELTAGATTR